MAKLSGVVRLYLIHLKLGFWHLLFLSRLKGKKITSSFIFRCACCWSEKYCLLALLHFHSRLLPSTKPCLVLFFSYYRASGYVICSLPSGPLEKKGSDAHAYAWSVKEANMADVKQALAFDLRVIDSSWKASSYWWLMERSSTIGTYLSMIRSIQPAFVACLCLSIRSLVWSIDQIHAETHRSESG